jgi:hypothetical protein
VADPTRQSLSFLPCFNGRMGSPAGRGQDPFPSTWRPSQTGPPPPSVPSSLSALLCLKRTSVPSPSNFPPHPFLLPPRACVALSHSPLASCPSTTTGKPPSCQNHFSVRLGSNLSCASPPPPSPVLQDRGSAATDHWNCRHRRNTAAITASSWTPPLSGEFPPPRPCSAPSPCAAHPPRQDLAVGRPPSRHRWPRRRNSHGRGDHAACVLAAAAAKVC